MILLVAVAGGAGAVARFLAEGAITRRWPTRIPFGTMLVNVTGSFLLGVLAGRAVAGGPVAAALGTGALGGYTTFSAASVETVRLARAGERVAAVTYAVGTAAAAVAAAALGWWLGAA